MYKHWKAQQPQMERRISPVWRAIFGIFFFHALARRIHQALPEERQALWSPSKDATWAVLLTVAANLISHLTDVVPALEPYSLPSLLLLLTPLIPMRNIQRQANLASGDPQGTGNAGYSGYNLLFIVLGALYWLLILIGSAVILFGSSQAEPPQPGNARRNSSGSTSPAGPTRQCSRGWRVRTGCGFTCTTLAPCSSASPGIRAAGCTTPEVPTLSNRSHSQAAAKASRSAASGSASPNQTTPGRTCPPQAGQRGGSIRRPSSGSTESGKASR